MTTTRRLWNVWVIDDKIPVASLAERGDETALYISDRALPFRSHLLRQAFEAFPDESKVWEEPAVRQLVGHLLNVPEFHLTGFNHPSSAIRALSEGDSSPDLIVFDWEYSKTDTVEQHLTWIRQLLSGGFPFLCVYTHQPTAGVEGHLAPIKQEFDKQFIRVYPKGDVTAAELVTQAQKNVQGTMAGSLAVILRQVTEQAIGRALRRFAQLNLQPVGPKEANKFMGKELETLPAELLAKELAASLQEDKEAEAPLADVLPLVSRVVEEASLDSPAIREILKDSKAQGDRVQEQMFQAFQLYITHQSPRVLCGDICVADDEKVRFILTDGCTLARFSGKARNTVVYVELLPLTKQTWDDLSSGVPEKPKKSDVKGPSSISGSGKLGQEGIFFLPSIPFTGKSAQVSYKGYLLVPCRITHRILDPAKTQYALGSALEYKHLATEFPGIRRVATLTEPYISGLLGAMSATLFSSGTRDFIGGEVQRMVDELWAAGSGEGEAN